MKNKLKEIRGERIRRQFFTPVIYCVYFALAFLSVLAVGLGATGEPLILRIILSLFAIEALFVLLSLLNRRFFGKTVCVLCKDGIFYDDGLYPEVAFIPWDGIKSASYRIDLPQKSYSADRSSMFGGCQMEIKLKHKSESVIVCNAPHYLICKIKKYRPSIDAKLDGFTKFLLISATTFPVVAPILIILFV